MFLTIAEKPLSRDMTKVLASRSRKPYSTCFQSLTDRGWAELGGRSPEHASVQETGGAEGIRTLDLLDAIEARSQLRHGPTG